MLVEEHLPVVHVEHGVTLLGIVILRKPNQEIAHGEVLRAEVVDVLQAAEVGLLAHLLGAVVAAAKREECDEQRPSKRLFHIEWGC